MFVMHIPYINCMTYLSRSSVHLLRFLYAGSWFSSTYVVFKRHFDVWWSLQAIFRSCYPGKWLINNYPRYKWSLDMTTLTYVVPNWPWSSYSPIHFEDRLYMHIPIAYFSYFETLSFLYYKIISWIMVNCGVQRNWSRNLYMCVNHCNWHVRLLKSKLHVLYLFFCKPLPEINSC